MASFDADALDSMANAITSSIDGFALDGLLERAGDALRQSFDPNYLDAVRPRSLTPSSQRRQCRQQLPSGNQSTLNRAAAAANRYQKPDARTQHSFFTRVWHGPTAVLPRSVASLATTPPPPPLSAGRAVAGRTVRLFQAPCQERGQSAPFSLSRSNVCTPLRLVRTNFPAPGTISRPLLSAEWDGRPTVHAGGVRRGERGSRSDVSRSRVRHSGAHLNFHAQPSPPTEQGLMPACGPSQYSTRMKQYDAHPFSDEGGMLG
jgi:hypothetical protein